MVCLTKEIINSGRFAPIFFNLNFFFQADILIPILTITISNSNHQNSLRGPYSHLDSSKPLDE